MPVRLEIGGRFYELVRAPDEERYEKFAKLVIKMGAWCGEKDGQHVLQNPEDVLAVIRRNVSLGFLGWRNTMNHDQFAVLHDYGYGWVARWRWRWELEDLYLLVSIQPDP